jgi:GGDEF domain-containing protein
MPRQSSERVLLIGDSQREFQSAIAQALPGAQITSVDTVFDGIGELSAHSYTTILAAAGPIERRPEPAVRMLRQLAGNGRLVLFGHPTLEILSRRMLQFGCDDYIITPPTPVELKNLFGSPSLRLTPAPSPEPRTAAAAEPLGSVPLGSNAPVAAEQSAPPVQGLPELPFAGIFLDALLQDPHDAPQSAVRMINARLAPIVELRYVAKGGAPMEVPVGRKAISQTVRNGNQEIGTLYLLAPADDDDAAIEPILMQVAGLIGKVAAVQEKHGRLQKLAITDELTGVYNARYFRHFLTRLVDQARDKRFPVTLLLFDIDDFKKYNDQYGHGAGDEILKQSAKLIRRCCREHDLVARIGGDEFAVVFWDKEGPREPLNGHKPANFPRPPQTPLQMFERFKRLAASSDFSGLGVTGRGRLSVSGGLAVYPYDAQDVPGLIKAADDYLMFKAKRAGKNSVYLVEGRENGQAKP